MKRTLAALAITAGALTVGSTVDATRYNNDTTTTSSSTTTHPSTTSTSSTTTVPETTTTVVDTTTTTVLDATTTSSVPEPRITTTTMPNQCWPWADSTQSTVNLDQAIDYPGFVFYDTADGAVGTHSITGMYCGPPQQAVGTPPKPPTPTRLPDTGNETAIVALMAALTLAGGVGALRLARR